MRVICLMALGFLHILLWSALFYLLFGPAAVPVGWLFYIAAMGALGAWGPKWLDDLIMK